MQHFNYKLETREKFGTYFQWGKTNDDLLKKKYFLTSWETHVFNLYSQCVVRDPGDF